LAITKSNRHQIKVSPKFGNKIQTPNDQQTSGVNLVLPENYTSVLEIRIGALECEKVQANYLDASHTQLITHNLLLFLLFEPIINYRYRPIG